MPLRALVSLAILMATAPAAAQAGTLVVANKQAATATLLDVASGRTLATLPTGRGPHEVAASHDGRWAVVSDYGDQARGSTLTVIDLASRTVARTIDLSPHQRPHGIAFLPGDSVLAVTSETSQAVLLVRFATGDVTAIPTGQSLTHMLALSDDGSTVYTANIGAGSMTSIDLRTGQARSVPVAPRTEGIGFAAGNVWVGSNDRHTVTVLDGRTLAVLDTLPAPGFPYRVNAGGNRVVVSNFMSSLLRIFDVRTRAETATIPIPFDPARAAPDADGRPGVVGAAVSPDGRFAYVALQGMDAVAVVDLEARRVLRLLPTGRGPDGIALAPAR